MNNLNIFHRLLYTFSYSLAFPCLLPFLLPGLSGYLPYSVPCLFPLPSACFLALLTSLPCLIPCPAYFIALPFPWPAHFLSWFVFQCLSLPCLFPCPAYFRVLPTSVPCLLLISRNTSHRKLPYKHEGRHTDKFEVVK